LNAVLKEVLIAMFSNSIYKPRHYFEYDHDSFPVITFHLIICDDASLIHYVTLMEWNYG